MQTYLNLATTKETATAAPACPCPAPEGQPCAGAADREPVRPAVAFVGEPRCGGYGGCGLDGGNRVQPLVQRIRVLAVALALPCLLAVTALGQTPPAWVGVWELDEGFQRVELLLRSDGRYQLDSRSTDPGIDLSTTERGRYSVAGQELILMPYDYFGEPEQRRHAMEWIGAWLSLTRLDFPQTQVFTLMPGSREDVLAREAVAPILVGRWRRTVQFFGELEYTYRPEGYYLLKTTHEGGQFPPELLRGRYEETGAQLALRPYGGLAAWYDVDFFGDTLTLIKVEAFGGESATYQAVAGSEAEVRAAAAEALAFLGSENWQVGVWEVRDPWQSVDLTLRPDGYYIAENFTEFQEGVVRGRYTLEPGRIRLHPFVGQGLYARSNGEFGKVERQRDLDYYEGELQFIDLEALSQSVTLARKRVGTQAGITEKARRARAELDREGWYVGRWEVQDPAGWMEFTFRPDHRYVAQSGFEGTASQVERGRFRLTGEKLTVAPYAHSGQARGFGWDYYDGDLYLIGDLLRLVVARKISGSETEVTDKTRDPVAAQGERGSILGLWSASLPGQWKQLVFRPDGQFRLIRCQHNGLSEDYGLYAVDLHTRKLTYDSRFTAVQDQGLDFYGDTLTLYGGSGPPNTYTVNLGVVDAAIAASLAADLAEAQVDAQWLARVPIGPRDSNAVQIPTGDIPADPRPGVIFSEPTVLTTYRLYRRLIYGTVTFNDQGTLKSVAVVNTREWHFFPTGRVLVRFRNHHAGPIYPFTIEDISDSWGAYRVEPKPDLQDILHLYADNVVRIQSDLGEPAELTLEDGRRHLFWNKDFMLLSEWAAEQEVIPCEPAAGLNPSLMNTGLALMTSIEPDEIPEPGAFILRLHLTGAGGLSVSGTAPVAGVLVIEGAASLGPAAEWKSRQTVSVPAGPFTLPLAQPMSPSGFFRARGPAEWHPFGVLGMDVDVLGGSR